MNYNVPFPLVKSFFLKNLKNIFNLTNSAISFISFLYVLPFPRRSAYIA